MKILDHGYVELVEYWGSDERIIEAARMSTNKGFKGWETDEKLLRYLYEHNHMTPFEMCGMVFEIKAPIFVFREWHRHRTQSYNEMSARYIPLPDENYMPSVQRIAEGLNSAGVNKQAGAHAEVSLTNEQIQIFCSALDDFYHKAQSLYEDGIRMGIPKEIARLCVPVGRYSRMRAAANLRNWMQFLTLRLDHHAQWEIRQYAQTINDQLGRCFPRTWKLFAGDRSLVR